jgi:hypothetical protein
MSENNKKTEKGKSMKNLGIGTIVVVNLVRGIGEMQG